MQIPASWTLLITAVKHQVMPALGCTEPVSLALACATAAQYLDGAVERIEAKVSANLMKNGMGVTVPGTGMVGLPIAAAAGAIGGNAAAGLEVLKQLTSQDVTRARQLLDEKRVTVSIATTDKAIYSEATLFAGTDWVKVVIADLHTQVISIEKNGESIYYCAATASQQTANHLPTDTSVKTIFECATQAPLAELQFIQQAAELNNALSQEGLQQEYGLRIGHTLQKQIQTGLMSDDLLAKILVRTTAASDARMGGAVLPAMSNSGSGNQGIAATMPVVVVADYIEASEEQLVRAMFLSHALAIYIHQKFPPLSALCAASTASMGAAAGMAWLLSKGRFEPIAMAICNMIGDLAGIICDGASNSCAMKVSTSATSAFKAVVMALSDIRVTGNEGIVCQSVEQSIDNLCALASKSMRQTDVQIIEIMTAKQAQVSA